MIRMKSNRKINRSVLRYDELIWNINGLEMKLPKFYMTINNSCVNSIRIKPSNHHERDYSGELKNPRLNSAAKKIQIAWRIYQKKKKKIADQAVSKSKCSCPICYFRLLCKTYRIVHLNRSASLIQAYWLGYITRRNFLQDRSLRLLYKRVVNANASASHEQTLGYRTENAVNRLLSMKSFNNIDNELATLEVSTKMSPYCCIKVAKELSSILIAIINDSNRSELHKTRISYSIGTLLNICKFPNSFEYVIKRDVLINLCMKIAKIHTRCDMIMIKCTTLLYILLNSLPTKEKDAILNNNMNKFTITGILKNARIDQKQKENRCNNYDIKFRPYWCAASNAKLHFDDRSSGLHAIALLFKVAP